MSNIKSSNERITREQNTTNEAHVKTTKACKKVLNKLIAEYSQKYKNDKNFCINTTSDDMSECALCLSYMKKMDISPKYFNI